MVLLKEHTRKWAGDCGNKRDIQRKLVPVLKQGLAQKWENKGTNGKNDWVYGQIKVIKMFSVAVCLQFGMFEQSAGVSHVTASASQSIDSFNCFTVASRSLSRAKEHSYL